ncbi:MAG: hypothetical protein KBT29_07530 [Prevotellaceae bacterium]|nr:hypothetical protein [Candidatus Minthosoma caballi]
MKKTKLFAALMCAAATFGFVSCSDSMDMTEEAGSTSQITTQPGIKIVDASGNQVTNLSGEFGTYYVQVTSDGDWELSTPNEFINLHGFIGKGNALVPFTVANNWVEPRNFTINGKVEGALSTRAGEGVTAGGTQASSYSLEEVMARITSNLGAGYTLMPRADGNIALSTGIQIFNIGVLDSIGKANKVSLIKDDYYDQLTQYILTSSSNEILHKSVTVGAKGSIEASSTGNGGGLSVGVGVGKDTNDNSMYGVKRMLRNMFTREIDYANAIAIDDSTNIRTIAPGFRMVRDLLIKTVNPLITKPTMTAADSAKADLLCEQFCSNYGTTFVSKAQIGCSFDYYIKVDSTYLNDSVNVAVVLQAKYDKVVTDSVKAKKEAEIAKKEVEEAKKDTSNVAKEDSVIVNNKDNEQSNEPSAQAEGDEVNKDTTSIKGDVDVEYRKNLEKATNSAEVQVLVYGGDTKDVDILGTGGILDVTQIQKWRGTVSPSNAVMTDLEAQPISALFITDPEVQAYLYDFIKRKCSTTNINLEKDKK